MRGLEYFLYTSIILLIAFLLLFIILLYKSRFKNIRNQKLITEYTLVIDKVLFPVIFSNSAVDEVIGSKDYQTYAKNKKFKNTLLEQVMSLHIVYKGDKNLHLDEFYRKSGLVKISFAKLTSLAWNRKCEGIRELSQMNIQESFFEILNCIWHRNATLKLEALLGLIRLRGLEGLSFLNNHTKPINDWIQVNILYEIDKFDLTMVPNFSYFLKSKNETLVLLGLRLIAKFTQIENRETVIEIQNSNASGRVKKEAAKTLSKLPYTGIYTKVVS